MSKFMIASEENMQALAHYGVRGMKWRQRKAAMKNTAGMTAAMQRGASKGEDASIEAEKIVRREKTAKAIKALGNLINGGSKLLKNGIKANVNTAKAINDKAKNSIYSPVNAGKTLGKGLYDIGAAGAAPIKTKKVTSSMYNAGVVGGTSAVQTIVKNKKKNKH